MGQYKLIQSVIFDKKYFTPSQAMAWLRENNYKFSDIHTTERYHRFRQFEPDYSNPEMMYLTLKGKVKGIKYIIFLKKKDYYSVINRNQQ